MGLLQRLRDKFRPSPSPQLAPPPIGDVVADLLAAHNRERAARGVSALRLDPRLSLAAQQHAAAMAASGRLSHDGFAGRVAAAGYRARASAENVAGGQRSVAEVMASWTNSTGHRTNLLDAAYADAGFGRAGDFWCAIFGRELRQPPWPAGGTSGPRGRRRPGIMGVDPVTTPEDPPVRLWLIRHAESEANVGLATDDFAGVRLTERGERQAVALAAAVPERPDRVVCSPFARTQLTAAPTLARFPGIAAEPMPVHEFTYLCADRCRGTSPADRLPMVREYWGRMDPTHQHGPAAESFAAFAERVRTFLGAAEAWDGFTLVFTHEMFVRAAVWAVLYGEWAGSADEMRRFDGLRAAFPVPNASYLPCEWRGGRLWLGGIERGHLAGVG